MLTNERLSNAVCELLRQAVTELPEDVEEALRSAFERENSEIARVQLSTIIRNVELAREKRVPICQDTGMHTFYVKPGNVSFPFLEESIREGVKLATEQVPLRPNIVEPLERSNLGNNVGFRMPYIHYKCSDEDRNNEYIEITVVAKGAGSENMSVLGMLSPTSGLDGVKEFVLDAVMRAGSKPCPPTLVGLGIGGSAEIAVELSKEALIRPINVRNSDEKYARLENDICDALNLLGIGPMGLGGNTTALGVNIEYAGCHTASLPVAMTMQCWAARRATMRVYKDGKAKYVSRWAQRKVK